MKFDVGSNNKPERISYDIDTNIKELIDHFQQWYAKNEYNPYAE